MNCIPTQHITIWRKLPQALLQREYMADYRVRWRRGVLLPRDLATAQGAALGQASQRKQASASHTPLAGFVRAQGQLDFAPVQGEVIATMADNNWIKPSHIGHVSDYVAHLVAATYASVGRCDQTQNGYRFLAVEFPHPNDVARDRTKLAKELVDALAPHLQHQIFGLMVWRFHNKSEAKDVLEPLLVQFCSDEDVGAVRTGLRTAYAVQPDDKSYLFSQDGLRGGGASWRDCVLDNLVCWWAVAQRLATVLRDPATTQALWHATFLKEILGSAKCFGVYFSKFLYGDIGNHLAGEKADLAHYTMIGPGCFRLREMWGLLFSGNAAERQWQGLEVVNELRACVAAIFQAGTHQGIERAREGGLKLPTAYDCQVQTCEHKCATREGGLHSRLTTTRRALWPACESCGVQEAEPARRKRRAAGPAEAAADTELPPKKRRAPVVQAAPEALITDAPRASTHTSKPPACQAPLGAGRVSSAASSCTRPPCSSRRRPRAWTK